MLKARELKLEHHLCNSTLDKYLCVLKKVRGKRSVATVPPCTTINKLCTEVHLQYLRLSFLDKVV